MIELIQKLTETFSPSGYEDAIREVILNEIKPLTDEVRVDALGNIIARKGEKSPKGPSSSSGQGKRVMVAAHMDEIGLIATHIDEVASTFDIPGVSDRIVARLQERIQFSLHRLRSPHRFNEQDRLTVLLGLLTSRTLGIRLPKASSGRTFFEEYDQLMRQHKRREEFNHRRTTEAD